MSLTLEEKDFLQNLKNKLKNYDTDISLLEYEPLLKTYSEKLQLFPIQFGKIWKCYKEAEGSFWTAEEIDLKEDKKDWMTSTKLTPKLKELVENMLAFFSGADKIVNDNLAEDFRNRINIMEVRCFYDFQIMMENIHNEVYSLLIDVIIDDKEKKNKLLNASNTMQNVSKLYEWAKKWIPINKYTEIKTNPILIELAKTDRKRAYELADIWSFNKRLVAFACVEGIMFSAPFCVIFWLKELGVLPGLTFSNEKISCDEGMHTMFACELHSMMNFKPPDFQLKQIITEAVEFEKEFIDTCIDGVNRLSKKTMHQYIEFVSDKLLSFLGYQAIWNVDNPYPFMDKISINGLTNFFEKRVAEYGIAGFEETEEDNDGEAFAEDF